MSKLGNASGSNRLEMERGQATPLALIQRIIVSSRAAPVASRQESTCVAQVIADWLRKFNRKYRSSIAPHSRGCSLYGECFWAPVKVRVLRPCKMPCRRTPFRAKPVGPHLLSGPNSVFQINVTAMKRKLLCLLVVFQADLPLRVLQCIGMPRSCDMSRVSP
jgi:hypothetical protein